MLPRFTALANVGAGVAMPLVPATPVFAVVSPLAVVGIGAGLMVDEGADVGSRVTVVTVVVGVTVVTVVVGVTVVTVVVVTSPIGSVVGAIVGGTGATVVGAVTGGSVNGAELGGPVGATVGGVP